MIYLFLLQKVKVKHTFPVNFYMPTNTCNAMLCLLYLVHVKVFCMTFQFIGMTFGPFSNQ